MPKVRKERTRRHATAARSLVAQKEAEDAMRFSKGSSAFGELHAKSVRSLPAGDKKNPFAVAGLEEYTPSLAAGGAGANATGEMLSFLDELDTPGDTATMEDSSQATAKVGGVEGENGMTGAEKRGESKSGSKRFVGLGGKKLSKKEKQREKRQHFLNKFMMPGENSKFGARKVLEVQGLSDTLPEVTAEDLKVRREQQDSLLKGKKITSYRRAQIATVEIDQFSQVLSHPAFQQNPMAALRQHLNNTYEMEQTERDELGVTANEKKKMRNIGKRKKGKKK